MNRTGSGGGGFVLNLGTFAIIAAVVALIVLAWMFWPA